jgi:hypothetical protein
MTSRLHLPNWLCARIFARLWRHADRLPDFVIKEPVIMKRWWVIPKNRLFNVYLHEFLGSDNEVMHTHPWVNCSILLHGKYIEHLPGVRSKLRRAGDVVFRMPSSAHRIELLPNGPHARVVWTLFITGPKVREWGFLCPGGWVHWKDFTAPGDSGRVGPGCGE